MVDQEGLRRRFDAQYGDDETLESMSNVEKLKRLRNLAPGDLILSKGFGTQIILISKQKSDEKNDEKSDTNFKFIKLKGDSIYQEDNLSLNNLRGKLRNIELITTLEERIAAIKTIQDLEIFLTNLPKEVCFESISLQRSFTKQEILGLIKIVKNGEEKVEVITNAQGLQSKVRELLKKEKIDNKIKQVESFEELELLLNSLLQETKVSPIPILDFIKSMKKVKDKFIENMAILIPANEEISVGNLFPEDKALGDKLKDLLIQEKNKEIESRILDTDNFGELNTFLKSLHDSELFDGKNKKEILAEIANLRKEIRKGVNVVKKYNFDNIPQERGLKNKVVELIKIEQKEIDDLPSIDIKKSMDDDAQIKEMSGHKKKSFVTRFMQGMGQIPNTKILNTETLTSSDKKESPRSVDTSIISGVIKNQSFEHSRKVGESGQGIEMAGSSDEGVGYSKSNQDRLVMNFYEEYIAVIDGMGGYADGAEAAQILAEELAEYPDDPNYASRQASKRIKNNLDKKSGAVFVSAKINREGDNIYLDEHHSGDCQLMIIRNGKVAFVSKQDSKMEKMMNPPDYMKEWEITSDEALYHSQRAAVYEAVQHSNSHKVTKTRIKVEKGDRILLMSDGISDNLTPNEIRDIVEGLSVVEAMDKIDKITEQRMRAGDPIRAWMGEGYELRKKKGLFKDGYRSVPKSDNRTFAIMDVR